MSSSTSEVTVGAAIKKYLTSSPGEDFWGTSAFKLDNLHATVTHFHFVAHENVDNVGDGKQPPTNHWSLFLSTSSGSSVRLEAVPNEPGRPGMIIPESKSYEVSTKITHKVTIAVPSGVTVANIFDLIIKNHRDIYVFAPVGEGCRFWLWTLAGDLAAAGIISSAHAHAVQTALGKYWPYPTGTAAVDRPMAKGEFPESKQ